MNKALKSALALTAGFGLGVGTAQAQEGLANTADEIVVTVQMREQRILDVPIAVTAYNSDFLDRAGITKYDDLALFVPGLEVQEQSANNTGFTIRGVTTDSGGASAEPRIAVFQDGVSTSRNRGTYMELYDIERIEVARGPQATLFGRGALIGAVNVIQHKADLDRVSFAAEAGGGEDEYYRGLVVLNAPLVQDKFALRFAATTRNRAGYVDNLAGGDALGGVNVVAGRIAAAFQPAPNLRFDLIGNIHKDDNTGTAFKSGTFAPTGSDTSPYTPAALNTFGGFENGRELGLDREVRSLTLIGAWDINSALKLTSITGGRDFDSFETFDPDGSSMPLIAAAEDAHGEQFSQEFRLAWDNGGPLSGFAGASYFREKGSQRAPTQYDERYALAFATGLLTGPATPNLATVQALGLGFLSSIPGVSAPVANLLYSRLNPAHREFYTNTGETKSWDVFADATLKATDKLEFTAGLRYTRDDKTTGLQAGFSAPSALGNLLVAQTLLGQAQAAAAAAQTAAIGGNLALAGQLAAQANALATQANGIVTGVALGAPLPVGLFTQPQPAIERSGEFDGLTWRFVGRYAAADNLSLWASYARGRRPDVIDISPGNLPGTTTSISMVPEEIVDSYETGLRAEKLAGGALDLDGSVYYYTYDDFQTTEIVAGAIRTVNAGEASAYGFEGALQWRPAQRLNIFATYAYNHARFDSGARDGNHFRLSPDHSASFGLTYEVPVGAGVISFTPTYTWQSKIFFDDDNDRRDLQPPLLGSLRDRAVDEKQGAYGLLNARLGFEHENGRWGVSAFVKNALDEDYLIDAGNVGDSFTIPTFIRGTPRLFGVELTTKF